MRKLAIAVCLIGLLVGSTLGGMALADKGGDPNYGSSQFVSLDDLEQGMDTLLDEMVSVKGNLTEVKTSLETLEAEVASVPRMKSYLGTESTYWQSDYFFKPAHFEVSLLAWIGAGGSLTYYGTVCESNCVSFEETTLTAGFHEEKISFTGNRFVIDPEGDATADYAITVTYTE